MTEPELRLDHLTGELVDKNAEPEELVEEDLEEQQLFCSLDFCSDEV